MTLLEYFSCINFPKVSSETLIFYKCLKEVKKHEHINTIFDVDGLFLPTGSLEVFFYKSRSKLFNQIQRRIATDLAEEILHMKISQIYLVSQKKVPTYENS